MNTICLWIGRVILVSGGLALTAGLAEQLCSFAYRRMKCVEAFLSFLVWRHQQKQAK